MAIRHAGVRKPLRDHTAPKQRSLRAIAALAMALLVPVLSAALPVDAGAAPGDPVAAHGCTVTPLPPQADSGQMFARMTVRCTTDMEGRFILVELSEQRGDGPWQVVTGASMTLEVPERLPDDIPAPSQADAEEVDGPAIGCLYAGEPRRFKTIVTISDGHGNQVTGESPSVDLDATCSPRGIAAAARSRAASDPYLPNPEDCQVAPISDELLVETLELIRIMRATPDAPPPLAEVDDPLEAESIEEDDIPQGVPADAATVAAITELEQQYAASHNAGDFRRAAALVSAELRPAIVAFPEAFHGIANPATPIPPPYGNQIPSVCVEGVRVLPDGRVAAIVDWQGERNLHLYEQVDGRSVLADEISIIG